MTRNQLTKVMLKRTDGTSQTDRQKAKFTLEILKCARKLDVSLILFGDITQRVLITLDIIKEVFQL